MLYISHTLRRSFKNGEGKMIAGDIGKITNAVFEKLS
jgi:hypothetical protein